MKKIIALSMASAMLLSMSTVAFADIETGIVDENGNQWPNEFGFGGQIQVMRGEEVHSYDLQEKNKIELQPGDDIYLPLYFTTAEGESVTIGASKEEMTGHVPYNGQIDKNWKLNFVDKTKAVIETAEFYKAQSSDKHLVKGAVYVKAQTKDEYNSLDALEYNFNIYINERYTQNKTEQIQMEGNFANPSSDKLVDFEWDNNVYEKSVWEVAEDQDGTATFNFNDNAYYTVRMFSGDKVMLEFDRLFDREIASRYAEDLYFYNFRGDLDSFNTTGTLIIPVDEPMYLYQVVNGALKATEAVYNEENEAMELKTRSLGNYVLSPTALDISAEAETPSNDNTNEETVETPSNGGNGQVQESNDYLGGNSDKGNPDTGSDDMIGLAVALAAVSLAGAVALGKKRR